MDGQGMSYQQLPGVTLMNVSLQKKKKKKEEDMVPSAGKVSGAFRNNQILWSGMST